MIGLKKLPFPTNSLAKSLSDSLFKNWFMLSVRISSYFDVLCDLLKDRCTAIWNLFVLYNRELNFVRITAALFRVRRAKVGRSEF